MEAGHEIPAVRTGAGGNPRVLVFTGGAHPLSLAQTKRARFVSNLKADYLKLKEALAFVERFALSHGISSARVEAIRKASAEALEELTSIYEAKVRAYDSRKGGGR
jgi:hypothetical protein